MDILRLNGKKFIRVLLFTVVCFSGLIGIIATNGPIYPDDPAAAPLQGTKIYDAPTGLKAQQPSLAWNGSNFGVFYVLPWTNGSAADLNFMRVDTSGALQSGPRRIITIPSSFWGYRSIVSNLVWNPDDQQFAFAYAYGKYLWFKRLTAVGGELAYVKIEFPGLPDHEHPHLIHVSLVYNTFNKEYALTFVTREDPYDESRHDDIYITRIKADGTFVGPYARFHAVDCPEDCYYTSLAYSKKTGKYLVSYMKNMPAPSMSHTNVTFIDSNFNVSEHRVFPAFQFMGGWHVQTHYDPRSGDFLVLSDNPSRDLISQTIKEDGTLGSMLTRTKITGSNGYWDKTLADVTATAHNYLISTSARVNNSTQIYGWHASETQHDSTNLIYPPNTSTERYDPYLTRVGSSLYQTWIDDGDVYFGKIGN